MRFVQSLLVTTFVCACAAGALAADQKTYGAGVTGEELVKVSDLLAKPDAYIGKTVRVKGLVVGTCAHRGCWINVAGETEGESVRVKVQDGVIVFPPELVGDTVIAEGVWTANELTMEQTKQVCAAEARKEGKEFDEGEVTTCMTLYQISGTGAVVVDDE
jgi:hypothetical protein